MSRTRKRRRLSKARIRLGIKVRFKRSADARIVRHEAQSGRTGGVHAKRQKAVGERGESSSFVASVDPVWDPIAGILRRG